VSFQSLDLFLETVYLVAGGLARGVGHPVPNLPEGEDSGLFIVADLVVDAECGEEFRGLCGRLDGAHGQGCPESVLQLDPGLEDPGGCGLVHGLFLGKPGGEAIISG
jgi:hypothetical protein